MNGSDISRKDIIIAVRGATFAPEGGKNNTPHFILRGCLYSYHLNHWGWNASKTYMHVFEALHPQ